MTTCAVCTKEITTVCRQFHDGRHVCMGCNPFRRCPVCVVGYMQVASTPNDMGRKRCTQCGLSNRATEHKRAMRLSGEEGR